MSIVRFAQRLSRQSLRPIELPVADSGQVLVLDKSAIKSMLRYRQTNRNALEAGGQLFARLDSGRIMISEATGPRRGDLRTRTSFVPSRASEQREIEAKYRKGLHYVGDWHTHPEPEPRPSHQDYESIKDCFSRSHHQLNAFVLAVVGTSDPPAGLHVSLHDGGEPIVLLGKSSPTPRSTRVCVI